MVSKIFHVSDVHIRLYKRHKEYEQVFKRLFQYIEETKDENSIIFLGGDIVHSKTDMSPELIKVTSNFLKRCADILPTILICGNHDTNLNNSHRLDALTPIVESINHPNLQYWKDSGVYKFNGVSFSVFSVFDTPDKWILAKDIKAKYKIALHHGPIWGSRTDLITLEAGTKIDLFDGFDLGLLGDIHSWQFLNDEKTIGYSSSLIQQNYGESLDGHGLLVWDVKSKKAKFADIKNDFGYYTFYLINGKCEIPPQLPKNLRCRIKYENTSNDELEQFISTVGKKCKIVEVIKQKVSTNSTSLQNKLIGNSREISYQNQVITEYLSSTTDITKDELEEVCQLNHETNKQLTVQNVSRNVIWKPVKLEFSNMFSYGDNNVIDFTNFHGIQGISGANAGGKSSIFDILCFVIYDKSTRAFKSSHILNNEKDSFYCKVQIELNGQDYFIERIGTKMSNGSVRVDVNFWTIDGADRISLNGEDRDKTNYSIREYFGLYDDFVMTALSSQYDNQNFVEKSQRDRKDLLYKFLDINIYDELYKISKENSREFQVLIREFEKDDVRTRSSTLYQLIENLEIGITATEVELRGYQSRLRECNNELAALNKSYIPIEENLDLTIINNDIEKCSNELVDCVVNLKEIDFEITKLDEEKASIENSIDFTEDIKNPQSDYLSIQNDISNAEKKIEKIRNELRTCRQKEEHLSKHRYDPNCEFCIDNDFVKDAIQAIEKIPSIEVDISSNESLIEALRIQSSLLYGKLEQYNIRVEIERKLQLIVSQLSNYSEKKNALIFKGKSIKEQLKNLDRKKNQYYEQQTIVDRNKAIIDDIKKVKDEIHVLEKDIEALSQKHKVQFGEIERKRKEYEECNSKLDKYLQYIKKYRIYELYLQALSREGVPYKILESVLPVIENEVNVILSQIVNFTVRLEATDEKYIHAYINYDGVNSWPVELSSGMERFILSLAFRCSLSEITSLPKANFLAIDEGFGVLDSENIQQVGKLFAYLKTQYDYLLIISHIEMMRDMVDRQLVVEKQNGFSRILG